MAALSMVVESSSAWSVRAHSTARLLMWRQFGNVKNEDEVPALLSDNVGALIATAGGDFR